MKLVYNTRQFLNHINLSSFTTSRELRHTGAVEIGEYVLEKSAEGILG